MAPLPGAAPLRLFLAGDVMLGRGVDQVLPTPGDPHLHERFVRDARRYVRLAETAHGRIPTPAPATYPWGEALATLDAMGVHARLINLETAVTTADDWQRDKGIHYRMHPANVEALTAARIDACVLANNHALDWGRDGLVETLATLQRAGVATVGAGRDAAEASRPALVSTPVGPLRIHAFAAPDAGVPASWAARDDTPGVNRLPEVDGRMGARVAASLAAQREPGERVVVSMHWGPNWGHDVPAGHRAFAHALIDGGAADVVHGHSSHHVKGVEVYRDRPVLYGCGDLIDDYEGIGGYERYRAELSLLFVAELAADGELRELEMVPMRLHRFRLRHAGGEETKWLTTTLEREGRVWGTGVRRTGRGTLTLTW